MSDHELLQRLCALVNTLYGHTERRCNYRVRLRPDIWHRIELWRRANYRYPAALDNRLMVLDKAVVTSR